MPLTKLKRSTHIDRAHKDPKTNGFIVAKPMTPAEIMGEKKGTYLFHRGESDTLLCLVADCILIPGHMELPDDGDGSFHFRRNPRPSTINVLLGAGIVSPYSEMASFVEDRTDTRRPNTGRPNLTDYDRFIGVLRQGGLGKLFGIDQSGFRNANSLGTTLPVAEVLTLECINPPRNAPVTGTEVELTDLIRTVAHLGLVLRHELKQVPGMSL